MKTCLFLIDVQYGFISDKTRYILKRLDSILDSSLFDYIIASKFINAENSPYMKYMNWFGLTEAKDIKLYEPIESKAKLIIEKNIYTGVNDESLNYFKTNNITKIYLAGIDTDCCVLKTAVDLFELGIQPNVLEYYSASNGGQKSHEAALTVMNRLVGYNSIIRGNIV
jgi:nicotinamidase-related amidase